MIRLDRVSRTFIVGEQPVYALVDVSERIGAGEYVSLMGPSGSGKSTLLNVLGCLDRPTSGVYALDGREVQTLPDAELTAIRRHEIGFVFQFFHLVPRLTAAANVELPMVFAGVPREERTARVAEALAAVGLTDRAHHKPEQLSGGQRQRVAIARAIIMRPRLLLADEPTGNLDTKSGQQVIELLEELNQSGEPWASRDVVERAPGLPGGHGSNAHGLTLIVVTHDPNVARRADRVLVLADGRIVERVRGSELAGALVYAR